MKNNKSFFILLAVLVVVLVGAWFLYDNLGSQFSTAGLVPQQTIAPETTGSTAETVATVPNITVTDLQGKPVQLHDFFGKPILLNFWASWCGPCKSEMPDLDAAYRQYSDDIHFLIVNLTDGSRETVESASSYIRQEGYSFPVYYDTSGEAALAYQAYSIPVTYFISADGEPIAYYPGAMSRDILQQGIDLLLE